ncbi:alpha/beta fold hydrolase [Accumulibacter sp.]|uniref:lipase family alpha/beta hydrolase n=1 Tax=Accumulibacter sp. TaxID=2053492 RepID=UPI0026019A17|nr:alpha/beta fold hydrolase [Accumulibacter sp.]
MLARALRLALLVEVTLYVVLARYACEASPAAAGLLAVLGVLALRAALVGLTYAYAWAHRSPAPRLAWWQWVRMLVGEYAAFVFTFVVLFPLAGGWMRADCLRPRAVANGGRSGESPPVLLIHGYGCARPAWWYLSHRLQTAGWVVATIDLEPVYASIDDYLAPLARRIETVLAETGADQLILVGHSMGGLVARAYLQRFGIARVAGLVTLGTPHQGSRLAHIGLGRNAYQMRPGSAWLQSIATSPVRSDTVVIYSPHDNFVMPQSNLVLQGAQNQQIEGLGHLAMLYSPRVARALLLALESGDKQGRAARYGTAA